MKDETPNRLATMNQEAREKARDKARQVYVAQAGDDLAEALRRCEKSGQVQAFNAGFDAGLAHREAEVDG